MSCEFCFGLGVSPAEKLSLLQQSGPEGPLAAQTGLDPQWPQRRPRQLLKTALRLLGSMLEGSVPFQLVLYQSFLPLVIFQW